MHAFGRHCDKGAPLSLAKSSKLAMVEDAAESLGSFYSGRHTGTLEKVGVVSFNGARQ